jgi:ABC-type branched-subunit amino acid transport system permease subunit
MEFNWNYVWAAIAVNFLIVYIVPRLIKKPTGVQVIDDVILFLNSQKGFFLASSIVVAVVTYASHYWVNSQGGDAHPSSPARSEF